MRLLCLHLVCALCAGISRFGLRLDSTLYFTFFGELQLIRRISYSDSGIELKYWQLLFNFIYTLESEENPCSVLFTCKGLCKVKQIANIQKKFG